MKLDQIQDAYFEFCLKLLQMLPSKDVEENNWADKAHSIRNELKQSIVDHGKNNAAEAIQAIELEIVKLRIALLKKET